MGLYASYAPGFIGKALGAACTLCLPQDVRLGIEMQHHLAPPERAWDPWLGVGAGYEWLLVTALGGSGLAGLQGLELANVQFGLDHRGADGCHIGPFAALAVGAYLSEVGAANSNAQVPTSLHAWMMLGFQVTWGPLPNISTLR